VRYMCLMGSHISAGFSALESCETGVLPSVTVWSVYVCSVRYLNGEEIHA